MADINEYDIKYLQYLEKIGMTPPQLRLKQPIQETKNMSCSKRQLFTDVIDEEENQSEPTYQRINSILVLTEKNIRQFNQSAEKNSALLANLEGKSPIQDQNTSLIPPLETRLNKQNDEFFDENNQDNSNRTNLCEYSKKLVNEKKNLRIEFPTHINSMKNYEIQQQMEIEDAQQKELQEQNLSQNQPEKIQLQHIYQEQQTPEILEKVDEIEKSIQQNIQQQIAEEQIQIVQESIKVQQEIVNIEITQIEQPEKIIEPSQQQSQNSQEQIEQEQIISLNNNQENLEIQESIHQNNFEAQNQIEEIENQNNLKLEQEQEQIQLKNEQQNEQIVINQENEIIQPFVEQKVESLKLENIQNLQEQNQQIQQCLTQDNQLLETEQQVQDKKKTRTEKQIERLKNRRKNNKKKRKEKKQSGKNNLQDNQILTQQEDEDYIVNKEPLINPVSNILVNFLDLCQQSYTKKVTKEWSECIYLQNRFYKKRIILKKSNKISKCFKK